MNDLRSTVEFLFKIFFLFIFQTIHIYIYNKIEQKKNVLAFALIKFGTCRNFVAFFCGWKINVNYSINLIIFR